MAVPKAPILFFLQGNESLAKKVALHLGLELGTCQCRPFPDGETYVRILDDLKGRSVLIFASLKDPNEKVMPLLFLAKAAKQMGALRVGLVAPYLAYMRQDIAFHHGEGISATFFAQFLSGIFDGLVTVDPHLHRIHRLPEIFSIPCRVVSSVPSIAAWIEKNIQDPVLIGPDSESQQWVRAVAEQKGMPYLILKKIRQGDREVEISIPDLEKVRSRTPVILDDIISTAQTMIATVGHLKKMGTLPPVCIGIHGVFSGDAYQELQNSGAGQIVTCNTVPHPSNAIDLTAALGAGIRAMIDSW